MDWEEIRGCGCFELIGIMVFVLAAILSIAYASDWQTCLTKWQDYNPSYGFWEGCRVEYHGRRIPVDAVRNVEVRDAR